MISRLFGACMELLKEEERASERKRSSANETCSSRNGRDAPSSGQESPLEIREGQNTWEPNATRELSIGDIVVPQVTQESQRTFAELQLDEKLVRGLKELRERWFFDDRLNLQVLCSVGGSVDKCVEMLLVREVDSIGEKIKGLRGSEVGFSWEEEGHQWCGICCLAFQNKDQHGQHMQQHAAMASHMPDKSGVQQTLHKGDSHRDARYGAAGSAKGASEMLLMYPCPVCQSQFRRPDYLRNHIRRHLAVTNDFNCSTCQASFRTRQSLTKHQVMHKKMNFRCDTCKKTFFRRDSYRRHVKASCAYKSTVQQCPVCNMSFLHRSILRLIQEGRYDWKADISAKGLNESHLTGMASNQTLDTHMLAHHPNLVSNYSCHVCRKRFLTKALHSKHKLRYMMREVWCAICGLGFHHNSSRDEHMVIHVRKMSVKSPGDLSFLDRFDRRKKCHVCSKTFTRNGGLTRHIRIHTNERRYSCTECPLKFRESGALRRHMRVHYNMKPYACPVCSKTFAAGQSRREHILRYHSDKISPWEVVQSMSTPKWGSKKNNESSPMSPFMVSNPKLPAVPPPLPPPLLLDDDEGNEAIFSTF